MRRSFFTGAVVGLVALIATPLLSGFVAGRASAFAEAVESQLAPIETLLARVGIGPAAASRAADTPPAGVEELFRPFWEAWDLIGREFYDTALVDEHKLFEGALRGMVGAVGDPYTLYLDPRHRELTEAELRGTFEGIGIQVEMTNQQLRIIAPLVGSPGERAGLRPGDVITHVDGQPIQGNELGGAIRLIRGVSGTQVTLRIQRQGDAPFDVTVTRERIRVEAVQGDVRQDGIAYLRITTFSSNVGSQLRRTLDRLRERTPIGWVLDLRGNPGGTLEGAITVASEFLEDGVVLYEQRRDGEMREIRRRGDARAATGPMAVLVDKGSASASEVVAGALRDNGRAALIGEQTFGKGLVQVLHRLSDGSALRLTIARWYTPAGELVQGAGLVPELAVEPQGGEDRALAQAAAYVQAEYAAGRSGRPPAATPPGSPAPHGVAPPPAGVQRAAEAPSDDGLVVVLDSLERDGSGVPGLA